MAKQRGIHQIRGKVGDMSYYSQSGVNGGLIRSINAGMSDRVKSADEYVNTRLNNAEFGQAGRAAAVLIKAITPKYRPMFVNMAQSKSLKLMLENIKTNQGAWGQRNFVDVNGEACAEILNPLAKGSFDEFGLSFQNSAVGGVGPEVNIILDATQHTDKLAAIGADHVRLRLVAAAPWIGDYIGGENKYAACYARSISDDYEPDPNESSGVIDHWTPNWRPDPGQGFPAHAVHFVLAIIMPVRMVNGEEHILQEACTFRAYSRLELGLAGS